MEAKQKKILVIAGISATVIAIVAIWAYLDGKATTTIAALPYDTDVNGNVTNAPSDPALLSQLATEMHNDMSGVSWFTDHDEDYYNQALALSDTDFVALYNTYNTKYQQQDSKTLTAMITSCWSTPLTQWATTKSAMLTKLGNLNLP